MLLSRSSVTGIYREFRVPKKKMRSRQIFDSLIAGAYGLINRSFFLNYSTAIVPIMPPAA